MGCLPLSPVASHLSMVALRCTDPGIRADGHKEHGHNRLLEGSEGPGDPWPGEAVGSLESLRTGLNKAGGNLIEL